MALEFEFAISAVQADCSENTLTDNTVYGNGELERHQMANFVVAAKMDVEGTPSYLDIDTYNQVTTSSATHNTTGEAVLDDYVPTAFTFPTTKDGWYQFLVLSFPEYSASADYVVGTSQADRSLIYYDSGDSWEGFYYCIQNNGAASTVVAPDHTVGVEGNDGTLYWTKLATTSASVNLADDVANNIAYVANTTDFTYNDGAMLAYVDNSTLVDTTEHNDLVTCYGEDCLTTQLQVAVDKNLCKDCDELMEIKKWQRLDVLINGAYAKNYQEKSAEAEEIMRFVEDYCASC
jgi:hypothetical protein